MTKAKASATVACMLTLTRRRAELREGILTEMMSGKKPGACDQGVSRKSDQPDPATKKLA